MDSVPLDQGWCTTGPLSEPEIFGFPAASAFDAIPFLTMLTECGSPWRIREHRG